jgi:hypothetical protein
MASLLVTTCPPEGVASGSCTALLHSMWSLMRCVLAGWLPRLALPFLPAGYKFASLQALLTWRPTPSVEAFLDQQGDPPSDTSTTSSSDSRSSKGRRAPGKGSNNGSSSRRGLAGLTLLAAGNGSYFGAGMRVRGASMQAICASAVLLHAGAWHVLCICQVLPLPVLHSATVEQGCWGRQPHGSCSAGHPPWHARGSVSSGTADGQGGEVVVCCRDGIWPRLLACLPCTTAQVPHVSLTCLPVLSFHPFPSPSDLPRRQPHQRAAAGGVHLPLRLLGVPHQG